MCFACITTSRRGYVDTLASLSLVVDNIWRLVSISCYSRARGIDLQPKRYTIGISWHFFTSKVNNLVLNKNRLTTLRGKLSNCSDDNFCPNIQRTLAGFESIADPRHLLIAQRHWYSAPGVCGCNSAATEGRVLSLFTWTWYTSSWLLVQSEPEQCLVPTTTHNSPSHKPALSMTYHHLQHTEHNFPWCLGKVLVFTVTPYSPASVMVDVLILLLPTFLSSQNSFSNMSKALWPKNLKHYELVQSFKSISHAPAHYCSN